MLFLKKQVLRKPQNLSLNLSFPTQMLVVKGSHGIFYFPLSYELEYSKKEKKVSLIASQSNLLAKKKAFFGMHQILLRQICLGVLYGYRKQLNIVGIGYQASVEKIDDVMTLVLKLGFSHLVRLQIPSALQVHCPKPRILLIKGMNLQKVSNFASLIRSLKMPNPYKEKGIYYAGEKLRLKQGKKT